MDRSKWEKILTYFQSYARGHLVRKEVHRAREDFEDIVTEIDGGLAHLKWRETIISIPHFTDTDGPILRPSKLDVSACYQSPAATAACSLSEQKGEDHHLPPQKIEAEKDDSQIKSPISLSRECFHGSPGREDRNFNKVRTVSVMESTGDSTTIWSSLELDMNHSHSHKGSQPCCLAQEVPRTSEALRLHRNTLTMELVWLQQAIDSRKKYLSLKERLSIS
ncbi:IQ domain-containing protein C [Scomber scombrus]|uniref:IQ domain-containing protein C n=1 Tax=Scomber scombrus TaxID=13677 RepID=A0AAV1PHP3_SCOSC|nr:IQ domain-containing protein C [Scomber scombrus]